MKTTSEQKERNRVDFFNEIVRRKTGVAEWEWYRAEWVDGNCLLTGGIPTIGKRGAKTWDKKMAQRHIVSDIELAVEKHEYEKQTGLCHACYGNGDTAVAWSKDKGTEYRTCRRCGGTGKANVENNE